MSFNLQRGQTLTIPNGSTQSNEVTLACDDYLAIGVPVLDSCTLTVSGAVDVLQHGKVVQSGAMGPIFDEYGTQILKFAATTGGFVIALRGDEVAQLSRLKIGTSAAQNADRIFTLSQKTSDSG